MAADSKAPDGIEPDDWIARIAVAIFYLVYGLGKFSSDPEWVQMFHKIGWGAWFRYFAGCVECLGAVLVLVPRTALLGLALLAATMVGAISILTWVLHRPSDALFPAAFLVGLVAIALLRWREG